MAAFDASQEGAEPGIDAPEDVVAAQQRAAAALQWAENALTSGDFSGSPSQLPRRTPHPLPPGADQDLAIIATEIALCGAGWVMHHELAHVRLGHRGSGLDPLRKEKAADEEATEWLLTQAPADTVKKRSIGIAVAVITFLRLEDRVGRGRNAAGQFDHPMAIERLHIALADLRIDSTAMDLAAVSILRLLWQKSVSLPEAVKAGMSGAELLNELCFAYRAVTKG